MKKIIITSLVAATIALSSSAQTWNQVSVPTSAKLNDIYFASNSVGYIVGDSATILKTIDGGETWVKLNATYEGNSFGVVRLSDVDFVSETIGYLVMDGGTFGTAKTTDGGLTWTGIPNNNTNQCFPQSVYAFAEDDLMIGGSDCFQGTTVTQYQDPDWTVKTVNYQTGITDQFVTQFDFEGNLGVAAVNADFMLRSIDFGQTWDTVSVGLSAGSVLTSVMIASNNTVYAGYNEQGAGFGILFSTDNGVSWSQDINSATFFYPAYFGLCESNSGKIYFGAQPSNSAAGLIFELENGFWNYQSVDQPIYALDSYGNDVTFGIGDSGYVVVNQPLGSLSISQNTVPTSEMVLYPNPAIDVIHWDCQNCDASRIQIFDNSGRSVYVEVNPTNHSLETSNLPNGMYTFEILSEERVHTSKFVKQ